MNYRYEYFDLRRKVEQWSENLRERTEQWSENFRKELDIIDEELKKMKIETNEKRKSHEELSR